MDLSQYGISGTSGTSSQVSIPGLDGIQNALSGIQSMLPIITIGSLVVTVLFLVLYIVHIVRRWKVDKAIIETHKEVKAIRVLLEYRQNPPTPAATAIDEPQDTTPPAPATE
jgi:hypothetical protein